MLRALVSQQPPKGEGIAGWMAMLWGPPPSRQQQRSSSSSSSARPRSIPLARALHSDRSSRPGCRLPDR